MTDTVIAHSPAADEVVRDAARGDEVAFARLIAEHNAAMARVAYVIVGDREMTLDAVQSAWTIAWRRIGSLRNPSQVRSWLIAIAANEARQQRRRDRHAVVVDISKAMSLTAERQPGFEPGVVDLARALRQLDPDDRRLLALKFVAGLDSNEIATQVGISASGVRSRLSRLLEQLRAELGDGGGTER